MEPDYWGGQAPLLDHWGASGPATPSPPPRFLLHCITPLYHIIECKSRTPSTFMHGYKAKYNCILNCYYTTRPVVHIDFLNKQKITP